MMLPDPWANITRSSCFMLSSVPSTLVARVAASLSADCSVTGPGLPSVPAVLTATSRRPNRATVLSTKARTSSSWRTSDRTNSASVPSLPSSLTSFSPSSSCRPEITIRAPSCAKASAVARPIPVSAPVIKTTVVVISVLLESVLLKVPCVSNNPSSRSKLLCYFIYSLGIERNMPSNLRNCGKGILVRPHRIDGLLSSGGNAVVIAIALIRAVGNVVRPFQLGEINILTWNVLNGGILRFAKRQGVAGIGNHATRYRHDNASGIELDGDRMICTWKLALFFFHVFGLPLRSCSALQEQRRVFNEEL